MSRPLHLATAPRAAAHTWKRKTTTWADVCHWIDSPRTGSKDGSGFVFAELRETTVTHKGDDTPCTALHRNQDAVVSRSLLTLDADYLTPETRDELLAAVRAEGWPAVAWSTWRSTADAPRLRLLVLTDRDMTPDEYRTAAREVMDVLGADLFDKGSAEPERFMYDPTVPARGEFYREVMPGEPLPVDAVLVGARPNAPEPAAERHETPLSRPETPLAADYVESWRKRALTALDDLAALPEGGRLEWPGEPYGVGWDRGVYYAAQWLVQAANSGAGYTLDEARADFLDHAPAADGTYNPAYKWERAVRRVAGGALPHESAAEAFEPVSSDDAPTPGGLLDRFPRLDLGALVSEDRPPREWVVHGLLPAGTSVSLVAPAGVGKSLLALAMSLSVARGEREFAGLSIPRARRVLYVDQENTEDDVAERMKALGVRSDVPGLAYLSLPPLRALDTAEGGQELAALLDAYEVGPGDLVVLDSLQRVTGGPENDSDTMREFYRHTAVELKRRGVTVLRLDNAGKDVAKGARGTSSKRDDVDVELVMTANAKDPSLLSVVPGKVRIADIRALDVERQTDDDGGLTFSTAVDPFRSQVSACLAALAESGLPAEAGWRQAADVLAGAYSRAVIREAVKERKSLGGTP